MSKLEELIQEYCPDGVEYIELNKICRFQNGFAFKSGSFTEEGLKILRITNIADGKLSDDGYVCFNPDDYKENLDNYVVKPGNIVVAMSGATTGKIGYNYSNNKYYLNQRVGLFLPNEEILDNRFLYHWLLSQSGNILAISSGTGAQPNLSSIKMMKFKIPIPPLPVQEEIVRILDMFTELIEALQTELKMRKKQYEEISFRLLKNQSEVEQILLKDSCLIEKGKTAIQKANPGDYPLVVTTSERKTCDSYQFDNKAVCIPLISSRGHGVASLNHVYYQEGKFALGNILCAVIPKDETKINPQYLYYYFECTKDYTLVPLMKGGANVAMHISDIGKIKIPIPTIRKQDEIVSKLKVLEEYCNDVLPAEIAARQKQYEYYRDKLLTFKEKR